MEDHSTENDSIATLRVENRKLVYRSVQAERKSKTLVHALNESLEERDLWKSKYKRKCKHLLIALIPFFLLFLPITLPAAIFIGLKKKRSKKRAKQLGIVMNAFLMLDNEAEQEAFDLLERQKEEVAPEVLPLFRSMTAQSDAEWQTEFNSFLREMGKDEVVLEPGDQPRFHRIRFVGTQRIEGGPKVSVIMPTFNCEDTVRFAVQSVLDQSWRNLELIAVDDCSTDGTVGILKEIAATDDRMVVLQQESNGGPYVAKNRALSVATGAYVTGHDADDIALPDRIATQMQPMLKDPSRAASMGYMTRVTSDAKFSWPSRIGRFSYNGVCRLASISLLIRKDILDVDLGFWDTVRFAADSEMIARARDFLGEQLVTLETLTMLCLDDEGGLTKDAQHGILAGSGLSPTRASYRDSWMAWHEQTSPHDRFLPFPHHGSDRFFDAPEAMQVSEEAVNAQR